MLAMNGDNILLQMLERHILFISSFLSFEDCLSLTECSNEVKTMLEKNEQVWIQLGRLYFDANISNEDIAKHIFKAKLNVGSSIFYDRPSGYFARIFYVDMMRETISVRCLNDSAMSVRSTSNILRDHMSTLRRYSSFRMVLWQYLSRLHAYASDITDTEYFFGMILNQLHRFIARIFCEEAEGYCSGTTFARKDPKSGLNRMMSMLTFFNVNWPKIWMHREAFEEHDLTADIEIAYAFHLGGSLNKRMWACITNLVKSKKFKFEEIGNFLEWAGTNFVLTRYINNDVPVVEEFALCVAEIRHEESTSRALAFGKCNNKFQGDYAKNSAILLRFYRQVESVIGRENRDFRTVVYIDMAHEIVSDMQFKCFPGATPELTYTFKEFTEEFLKQHLFITRQTCLSSDKEFRRRASDLYNLLADDPKYIQAVSSVRIVRSFVNFYNLTL